MTEEIRALSIEALSDALQTGALTVAKVLQAWDAKADAQAAQKRLTGDAPFLCGIPFQGSGLVAENLTRAGAMATESPAPFQVIADWDGTALQAPLTFRPSFGLLPRHPGEGAFRALSEVPAIRAPKPRDLRRILQPASLRRWEDPDQVPLPVAAQPAARVIGAALPFTLRGYDVTEFAPPWPDFGRAWAAEAPEALALRPRARADWAVALHACPLVALPPDMAGLVAALGLPAARVGGVILAARWFADDLVLTAAALA